MMHGHMNIKNDWVKCHRGLSECSINIMLH